MRNFGAPDPAYRSFAIAEPKREPPPTRSEGIWGRLEVEATVLRPVHVGSGSWVVIGAGGSQLAAATVAQPEPRPERAPKACIPGSSLKGALRVVAEVLSPSCDPLGTDRCKVGKVGLICPACAVFGLAGWRGLVSPGELELMTGTELDVARVPQRYSHQGAPARGRRLYRLEPEAPAAGATEVLQVVPEHAGLQGEIGLLGVPAWGLGLLTIALGVGPMGLPLLRIGGGKNRGLGALAMRVRGGWWAKGVKAALPGGLGRSPLNDEAFASWQEAARQRFGGLGQARDRIAELYQEGGT